MACRYTQGCANSPLAWSRKSGWCMCHRITRSSFIWSLMKYPMRGACPQPVALAARYARDQRDAALGDHEAPAVLLRIEAHREAFRQHATLVHHDATQLHMPVHGDLR